jgi:hypothetical protein
MWLDLRAIDHEVIRPMTGRDHACHRHGINRSLSGNDVRKMSQRGFNRLPEGRELPKGNWPKEHENREDFLWKRQMDFPSHIHADFQLLIHDSELPAAV